MEHNRNHVRTTEMMLMDSKVQTIDCVRDIFAIYPYLVVEALVS